MGKNKVTRYYVCPERFKLTKLPFTATIKTGQREYEVEVFTTGLRLVRWITKDPRYM